MRILLVEDDAEIAQIVRITLERARFEVEQAGEGRAGLQRALRGDFGLVILDLMLPGMDGFRVCEELRLRRNRTPILMLTARDSVSDRVRGLDAGADDYLPKPFDLEELVARTRALLRRERVNRSRIMRVGDLQIDTTAGTVRRSGEEVHLTPREYTLLEALAANEGRIISCEEILERIWMDESYSNTVNVHLASLRRKVDPDDARRLIHTIRGRGFVLRAPDVEAFR